MISLDYRHTVRYPMFNIYFCEGNLNKSVKYMNAEFDVKSLVGYI
jgi:hypothetical protein